LGAIAAAIQISELGNTPIEAKSLLFEINQIDGG
jgi:hypothetical protein